MTDMKQLNLANIASTEALLLEVTRTMQKLSQAKQVTGARHKQWRELAKPAPKASSGISSVIFENMMMGLLVESLFGLPIFSGLSVGSDTVQALGVCGTALHHEATDDKPRPMDMEMSAMISAALMDAQKSRLDASDHAQKDQAAELARLKKLMVLMLATMMVQERSGPASRDAEMVPDVLREPKIARFKQNRQSISCIKTLFQKQAMVVTPAALRCA